MFQRVDYAFKRRKEENTTLAIAVADLENQLEHLETSTKDQIHSTASLNQSLSAAGSNIDQAEISCDSFESVDLEQLRSIMEEHCSVVEQGTHPLSQCVHELKIIRSSVTAANVKSMLLHEVTILGSLETELQRDAETIRSECEGLLTWADSETRQFEGMSEAFGEVEAESKVSDT